MCGISLSSLGSFTELWLNADPFPQHFSTSVPFTARASMTNLKRKRHNRSREEDASASVRRSSMLFACSSQSCLCRTDRSSGRGRILGIQWANNASERFDGSDDPSEIRGLTVMCAVLGGGSSVQRFLLPVQMCNPTLQASIITRLAISVARS